MNSVFLPAVSEELVAAWLDGNVTPEQDTYISQMCAIDPALQTIMDANDDIEATYDGLLENGFELPYELSTDFSLPHIEDSLYTEIHTYDDNDESFSSYNHDDYNDESQTDELQIDDETHYFDF